MKKAKLMLSAIAILGIVGGAFAFNAHKFDNNIVYTGATGGTSACTTQITGAKITIGIGFPTQYASTSSMSSGCPLQFTGSTAD